MGFVSVLHIPGALLSTLQISTVLRGFLPAVLISTVLLVLLPVLSAGQDVRSFKSPAPIWAINPAELSSYSSWAPTANPKGGNFQDRNTSVTPWKPWSNPTPLVQYNRPETCPLSGPQQPRPQSAFWLGQLSAAVQEPCSPFLLDAASYSVFRNVRDYGAAGDGETDDTNAFNRAITDQSRMGGGMGRGGSTGQPAMVYVPPGTYSISSSVQLLIGTFLVGDAVEPPTIRASANMRNNTVLVNGYDYGTQSTLNFYIGVRNIILDTTQASPNLTIYALNWAVSQATSLQNVHVLMPEDSNHVGLEMDGGTSGGGSGLFMADLSFTGGLIGILFNNQQYAIRNVKFTNVATGIAIQHAFVLTLLNIDCENVGICVDLGRIDVSGGVNLIDSRCDACGIVVNGTSSIVLENIAVTNSGPTLKVNGTSRGLGSLEGKTYVQGHIYQDSTGQPVASNGSFVQYTRRGNLVGSDGKYFSKSMPQYEHIPASAFVSVKDAGARGDGVTDDTKAIQQALIANADCKITYFPHGVYLVTETIYIPPGTRIVGQALSTITASGKHFANADDPQPMIQVGKPGEIGLVELTDLLFTVADVLPGAILVEVNMRGAEQGDVSFHNVHYRIGGAAGSRTETACQDSKPCPAAFMLLHIREGSSIYIENGWHWTADHDLDGELTQNIGTGRGVYVESREATWLVGTGSEHHALYAYQLHNAANVFAALLQVETPYWQPVPGAPAPWTPNATWHDPDFSGCEANNTQCFMSWNLRLLGSETHNIPLYGPGFWTFFNGPNYSPCPNGTCQLNMVELTDLSQDSDVVIFNLNTKGAQNMITIGGSGGISAATQAANSGSWGGVLAAYAGFQ